jgi:hypothetical protein
MMRHKASRTALGHFRDTTSKEGHHAIMARNIRHRFESRTARLKLTIRKKPYSGPALGNSVTLLYRRNAGNGTWVVKAPDGTGAYWTKRIAEADDYAEADSSVVLTYFAAQDRAKALAGGGDSDRIVRRTSHCRRGGVF